MSMFCYQCQETSKNHGCEIKGVCGKESSTAVLQDLLIYNLKGIAYLSELKMKNGDNILKTAKFITDSLFATITNANFDNSRFNELISKSIKIKKELLESSGTGSIPEAAGWLNEEKSDFPAKGSTVGVLSTENEDVRSLRELLIYGLKGVAAYAHHAFVLGYEDDDVYKFVIEGTARTPGAACRVEPIFI